MNVTGTAIAPAKIPDPPTASQNSSSSTASRALFGVAIFLGAFLLFSVQLLLGKYILPWFGGTAGVWATCLFFFQTTLLAGYAYAHGSVGRFSLRGQSRVHLAILASSLLLMGVAAYFWPSPITPGNWWKPQSGEIAVWLILRVLLVSVGAVVTLLATTGPLMQHWFTRAYPGESPYRLYALSNAGSLLGLLSYPALIERWLRLNTQAWLWCSGYAIYALATIALALKISKRETNEPSVPTAAPADYEIERAPRPTLNAKLQWFSLSALGSLMLLAISRFITADLAPVPLLWMLPLAVYLLSFVICFDHPRWYRPGVFHPLSASHGGFHIDVLSRTRLASVDVHRRVPRHRIRVLHVLSRRALPAASAAGTPDFVLSDDRAGRSGGERVREPGGTVHLHGQLGDASRDCSVSGSHGPDGDDGSCILGES